MKIFVLLLVFSVLLITTAFFPFYVKTESVMCEGMVIEATNDVGFIKIEAGKGAERIYSWSGGKEHVILWRRWSRWLGSLGLYSPGGNKPVHMVLEESQQHFCSEQELFDWLNFERNVYKWVYTSNGLIVGWRVSEASMRGYHAIVHATVYQAYINGKKPENLAGARNDLICVSFPNGKKENLPKPGRVIPSEPKMVNNRLYSGKALDLMKEHNISPKDVERDIKEGKITDKDDDFGWTYFWNGRVVVLDKDGRVILVYL
jgi:hypothetical protein